MKMKMETALSAHTFSESCEQRRTSMLIRVKYHMIMGSGSSDYLCRPFCKPRSMESDPTSTTQVDGNCDKHLDQVRIHHTLEEMFMRSN